MKKPVNPLNIIAGQHIAIFGQNGSGKSIAGMNLIHFSEVLPVVIYDTKLDDDFLTIIPDGYTVVVLSDLASFRNYIDKTDRQHLADYIIVRPSIDEIDEAKLLDQYLLMHYNHLSNSVAYIDEAFMFHSDGGRCFVGLKSILTRGRSRGISVIACTQRPFFVSMFIKSECKKFLCFRLTHPRDKKEVKDFTNCPESELPPYHFWFYDSNTGKGEIKKPVFDVRYEEND